MAQPMTGHQLIHFLLVFSTTTDVGAFLFDTDSCTRYAEYKDLINLAHVENCLSIDRVFTMLKQLGDHNDQFCFSHVLYQLGDRYGVSVQTPEDCQCNGTNSLLNYQYNVQDGTMDMKDRCFSREPNYKALFDQFFVDNGNTAPACRSHHSDSFDHHPSPCVCKQSLRYGDPSNCMQFHSYQALLRLKDTNLCTSKNSQWDLLHDLEIRSPLCRKNIIADLATHFHNPLSLDPCRCHSVKPISNDDLHLVEGKLLECSSIQRSSYSLVQQLQNIQPFKGYDCTMDLILRAANKYPSVDLDPCTCTGSLPTTTRATTAASYSPNEFLCQKIVLVLDITSNIHVHATGSTPCESKISGTNEDLVLTLCNVTSLETWSRGLHVISNCDRIPSYSPIATFSTTGKYMPLDAQSGVFLGCISEGFKMAIQPCNGAPQIIHVETTGVYNNNATIYYTVV